MLKDMIQTGDWKGEKHVPVIDAPDKVKKGEVVKVEVSVGKEIPHPNTMEHHISWIELYFKPDDEKFPVMVGRCGFMSHGEGQALAEPHVVVTLKLSKSGTFYALSYCNIHGLWSSEKKIEVE